MKAVEEFGDEAFAAAWRRVDRDRLKYIDVHSLSAAARRDARGDERGKRKEALEAAQGRRRLS